MGENIKYGIIFMIGASIGCCTTWFFAKAKYQKIADEEIADMREYYKRKFEVPCSETSEDEKLEEIEEEVDEKVEPKVATVSHQNSKPDISSYSKFVEDLGYKNYSDMNKVSNETDSSSNEENDETEENDEEDNEGYDGEIKIEEIEERPYIISPDEFGEAVGYKQATFIYYEKTKVIEDEYGNIIDEENADYRFGLDSLNHFGDYEEDAVHVRNEELEMDFEILRY